MRMNLLFDLVKIIKRIFIINFIAEKVLMKIMYAWSNVKKKYNVKEYYCKKNFTCIAL